MKKQEYLEDRLEQYCASDYYPFHMPGHKRQSLGMPDPYRIDITEIHGFDNLNHPEEILLDLNHEYRDLYHADEAWLTVNGSTGGNLAAVFAGMREGCGVLIQRNSHKSVYHALMLKHVKAFYQIPKPWTDEIPGLLDPEETDGILTAHPEIRLMVITSPSYEGVLQDVTALSQICHKHKAALIVDAAHGAHLGIVDSKKPEKTNEQKERKNQANRTAPRIFFPENPIRQGADVVILSLHKMLPAMTQTSMVLYNKNDWIRKEDLEESIRIFQTSSPSYVFMDGASRCIHLIEREGEDLFSRWEEFLESFYQKTKNLNALRILPVEGRDPSKIIICSRRPGIRGADLMNLLRNDYHLELEMAEGHYAIAMTSFMDTEEGMDRLTQAVLELDQRISGQTVPENRIGNENQARNKSQTEKENQPGNPADQSYRELPEKTCELWEAADLDWEKTDLRNAIGRTARDELCVYPPGIPLAVPGERITASCVETIRQAERDVLEVDGLDPGGKIRVLTNRMKES